MKKLILLFAVFTVFNSVSAQFLNLEDWDKTPLKDFGFYNIYINKYRQMVRHSWDDKKYPWNNPDKEWTNVFLPWGNVGIGTITPLEKLHVIGNVKIEGRLNIPRIHADSIIVNNLSLTNDFFAHRNILVDGNIGIGVLNPSQKLDIAGNISVSNSVFTDSLISNGLRSGTGTFTSLKVVNFFTVTGNAGFGVASPVERLEVAGNIKATNSIIADSIISRGFRTSLGSFSNLNISNNLSIWGKTGMGVAAPVEKLEVAGNIKTTNSLMADSVISKGLRVTTGSFANINLANNLVSKSILADSVISKGVRIDFGSFSNLKVSKTLLVSEKAEVNGSMKVNHSIVADSVIANVFKTESGSFSNLNIAGNFSVTGKTGLGVATPSEKLEVDGNIKTTQKLIATEVVSDTATLTKGLKVNGTISANTLYTNTIKLVGTQSLNIDNNVNFAGNSVMNQTLAIGTATVPSGYLMAVKGKIIAEEIKVRKFDTWPDYVFDNSYNLKSLYEVEQFIKQNNHLEGIPSAKQVQSEGVEMGDMQAKLLEKIEELTLYLIELKKENDKLAKKVAELEKK